MVTEEQKEQESGQSASPPRKRSGMTREFGKVNLDLEETLQRLSKPGTQRSPMSAKTVDPGVETNDDGQVSKVRYSDGTSRQFGYGVDGALAQVRDIDGSIWKTIDGQSWTQWKPSGVATGQRWEGRAYVDSTGCYTFEDANDGSCVTEKPDGSRLIREKAGYCIEANASKQIMRLIYPDGGQREFKYGQDGLLKAFRDKSGSIFTKVSDDTWIESDVGGKPLGNSKVGVFHVDKEGNLVFADRQTGNKIIERPYGARVTETATGQVITEHADGTKTAQNPDGTLVYWLSDGTVITQTSQGYSVLRADGCQVDSDLKKRIVRIGYADKTSRTFIYKEKGPLSEIKDRDCSNWRLDASGTWRQYTEQGLETGFRFDGMIFVDEQGNYIRKCGRTGATIVEALDGVMPSWIVSDVVPGETAITEEQPLVAVPEPPVESPDLAAARDLIVQPAAPAELPVERVARAPARDLPFNLDDAQLEGSPAGVRLAIDTNGRIIKVLESNETSREFAYGEDGEVCSIKDETGREKQKNEDDTWTIYTRDGRKMATSEKARITTNVRGDVIWQYLEDGSFTIQRMDSSVLRLDSNGGILQYVSPDKRKFQVVKGGDVEYVISENEKLTDIARDIFKLKGWNSREDKPSDVQIAQEAQGIAKANGIVDHKKISPGDSIVIPFKLDAFVRLDDVKVSGSNIQLNRLGQVIAIDYIDGSSKRFTYDADGNVTKIVENSGGITARNDDHTWSTFRSDGRKVFTSGMAYVTVSRDGNIAWGYVKEGSIVIERTDNSSIRTDMDGALVDYQSPSGRKFTVIGDGFAQYEVVEDDTLVAIAEDSLRAQWWEIPHYSPSQQQIDEETLWLSKDNKIADPNQLAEGLTISIMLPQL